jgi:16S rRNA pseudouridine516 synthase
MFHRVPARLDDLLSRNLGISRTMVARLVDAGRVTDRAGRPIRDRKVAIPLHGDGDGDGDGSGGADGGAGANAAGAGTGVEVRPAEVVSVDGLATPLFEQALVLLHKPRGVVTALRDARHPTAHALLHDAPLFAELRAAGRLDLDTTGLLLWTTDGALIQRLTHPKRKVPRTYQAALASGFGPPGPRQDLVLDDGHRPEITELVTLAPAEVHPGLVVPQETRALASITIVGGAYHEVRRIFAALGSHVLGLCRTSFGPYALPPDLPAGAWKLLPWPQTRD